MPDLITLEKKYRVFGDGSEDAPVAEVLAIDMGGDRPVLFRYMPAGENFYVAVTADEYGMQPQVQPDAPPDGAQSNQSAPSDEPAADPLQLVEIVPKVNAVFWIGYRADGSPSLFTFQPDVKSIWPSIVALESFTRSIPVGTGITDQQIESDQISILTAPGDA